MALYDVVFQSMNTEALLYFKVEATSEVLAAAKAGVGLDDTFVWLYSEEIKPYLPEQYWDEEITF